MSKNQNNTVIAAQPNAADVKADEPVRSRSNARHMNDVLHARVSRRATLRGGLGLAAATVFAGAGLAGCRDDDAGSDAATGNGDNSASTAQLDFASVTNSKADQVLVPDGYAVDVLIPWGTPILPGTAAFNPATNTAADQASQAGMHHDGMYFFQQPHTPHTGLLAINHENITRDLMFPRGRTEDANGHPTDPDEVKREMAAHGIAVVKLVRSGDGAWSHRISGFNRRITAMTEIAMSGPAAQSALLATPYSPSGSRTRGTLNNCGRGYTPWATYLSGEENFQGYFVTRDTDAELSRYGITAQGWGMFWHTLADSNAVAARDKGLFARFDITATGANAIEDWRNEARNFGWVVEIDPYDPASTPTKRTAMGRFRHEGVAPSRAQTGQPMAFYMGDDARGEYCYKFVTQDAWDPDNPVADMLDRGTLYVARFNDDGTGEWLPLDITQSTTLAHAFASQAEVLVKTRLAADLLDPTPMDRPEWSAVDPASGDIYYTLTNNSDRGDPGEEPINAANPRDNNTYGHIIRQQEAGANPAAATFTWDIFVFGAPAAANDSVNISGLTQANQFGSPDGLWFDPRGVLWIQTDNGGNAVAEATNNQMLAVIPASLPDDKLIRPQTQASLKRFLVGPSGCEMTGCDLSADNTTLFANVQHPSGDFPDYSAGRPPRSATLAIRRRDGQTIAVPETT